MPVADVDDVGDRRAGEPLRLGSDREGQRRLLPGQEQEVGRDDQRQHDGEVRPGLAAARSPAGHHARRPRNPGPASSGTASGVTDVHRGEERPVEQPAAGVIPLRRPDRQPSADQSEPMPPSLSAPCQARTGPGRRPPARRSWSARRYTVQSRSASGSASRRSADQQVAEYGQRRHVPERHGLAAVVVQDRIDRRQPPAREQQEHAAARPSCSATTRGVPPWAGPARRAPRPPTRRRPHRG